ncbi:MAG: tetratricopeptide repeat protein, partial [Desulfobacteraceae bacterium]|nr:tetratricopeptide repeat protein [Desulfobacteraceae bacterium]
MNTFKTITLALMLIIFSVTGLRAEEISLNPFKKILVIWELNSLQEEGEKAYYAADYPTALEKWEAGLKKAREIGSKRYISQFIGNIGLVYNNLGSYPKALEYYQQALKIKKEIGDKRGEGKDLGNIGVLYKNLGEYQKAKKAFQDSAVIFKEISSSDDLWIAQRGLASTEAKLNQSEPAIQHYEQALDNI